MIDGLLIQISSADLKKHLHARAAHHKSRAKWYAEQIASLRAGGLQRGSATLDPVESLERSAKRHKERFVYFTFMAEHLVPKETYRLCENDLSRIELTAASDF